MSSPVLRWLNILVASLIGLAALAAYCSSFDGAMVLDDEAAIAANRSIRHLWPIWPVLSPPSHGETVSGRPLLNLSLAVNYALGGVHVWGYHAVNLAIHVLAALLLYGIVRRTFRLPTLPARFGPAATGLALASALVWAVHPLQSESVTYIVQRAESLAGLFYLLTLYCVIRGAGTVACFATAEASSAGDACAEKGGGPRALWYGGAVVACLLGMATKEIVVTAPLAVLLYDRTFLSGSLTEAWRRRWRLYVGMCAGWGLLLYLVLSTGLVFRQAEMGAPDALSYARSQPGIIWHYLRLSFWPSPLCLIEEWAVANTLREIVSGAIAVGLALAAIAWGAMRRKAWSFPFAWFLLVLAPTSSVMPLGQLAYEHRMYLPLAAVTVLVVSLGYAAWDRLLPRRANGSPAAVAVRWAVPAAICLAVAVCLGCATAERNRDYRSLVAIWQDAVEKHPRSPRAHNNLGHALLGTGKLAEAIEHCRRALQLKPDYASAHYTLGNALLSLGRSNEATEHYQEALRLEPNYVGVHNDLALVLARAGKTAEAIAHFERALQLKPDYAEAHNNLGLVLLDIGKSDEAIHHYREALWWEPELAEAHNNLANSLLAGGKVAEAIAEYREAVRRKPNYAAAYLNWGNALAGRGDLDEAIKRYQQALQLDHHYAKAYYNLGNTLAQLGRTEEAIESYTQLLNLMPDSIEALNNLAWLLAVHEPARSNDPLRAVELAQRMCTLGGEESPQCLDTLAAAYASAGRFSDAVVIGEQAARLAESAGENALAKNIHSRLELYRAGRPYRNVSRLTRRAPS